MLKKISIALSLAAALALGVVFAAPAIAQPHHHHHGSAHHGYTVGHSYGGHVYYGRNRHRWHGRWYAYGIGPCWINVGGIWLWNVAACP